MEKLETLNKVEDLQKANMLIHGHDINSKPVPLSGSMVSLATELASLDLVAPSLKINPISKRRMRQNAKDYLESK